MAKYPTTKTITIKVEIMVVNITKMWGIPGASVSRRTYQENYSLMVKPSQAVIGKHIRIIKNIEIDAPKKTVIAEANSNQ